jgi:hypothetical protein
VPPGFADALKEAETGVKDDRPDTAPGPLQ